MLGLSWLFIGESTICVILILLHLIKYELRGNVIVYGLHILPVYMQNNVSLFWYIAA